MKIRNSTKRNIVIHLSFEKELGGIDGYLKLKSFETVYLDKSWIEPYNFIEIQEIKKRVGDISGKNRKI